MDIMVLTLCALSIMSQRAKSAYWTLPLAHKAHTENISTLLTSSCVESGILGQEFIWTNDTPTPSSLQQTNIRRGGVQLVKLYLRSDTYGPHVVPPRQK